MYKSLKFHEKSTYFGAFHILPMVSDSLCNCFCLSHTHITHRHTQAHTDTHIHTYGSLCSLPGNFSPHTAKHHSTQSWMHIKMAALYYQHQRCTRMVETGLIYHVLLPLPRCTAPQPHPFHFLSSSAAPTTSIMIVLPSFSSISIIFYYFFDLKHVFFPSTPFSH